MTEVINIIIICPHCGQHVTVNTKEINCAIFRHGAFIKSMKQIDPHASKSVCDNLVAKGLIYGCGKPFKLVKTEEKPDEWVAEECDYI